MADYLHRPRLPTHKSIAHPACAGKPSVSTGRRPLAPVESATSRIAGNGGPREVGLVGDHQVGVAAFEQVGSEGVVQDLRDTLWDGIPAEQATFC